MENLKTVDVSKYSGYRHNRYDGFNASWPFIIAAGGNGMADCFSNDTDEDIQEVWDALQELEIDSEEVELVILENLEDVSEVQELLEDGEEGESCTVCEYCGTNYDIEFTKTSNGVVIEMPSNRKFKLGKLWS